MKFKNLETTRYPIIYIGITFIVSSIFYTYYDFNFGLVVILTSLFFIFVTFRENIEFTLIIILIFYLGIVINNNFYNYIPKLEKVKITKNYGDFAIGEEKGRILNLNGNFNNIITGSIISIKGNFTSEINKEKGQIGSVEVLDYAINEKSIFTKLSYFREKVNDKYKESLGEKKGNLISSIIFGQDENLKDYDKELMNKLGIIHAVSVSGLHVGLIFLIFRKIFNKDIGMALTFLYIILTGMNFSSIRAFILLFVIYIGEKVKKTPYSLGTIALSVIIIFFYKPYGIFDIGYQLSYGATLGIILFNRKIEDKLYKINSLIRGAISISISAQIFVFPLLIIYFRSFSTAFIIGNIMLIPLINIILIIGILGVLTYKFNPIFNLIAFILVEVIDVFESLSRGVKYLGLEKIYMGEIVAYFYLFTMMCLYLYKRKIEFSKYMPIPYGIFLLISVYSINPQITYLREGGVLINYKGEKVFMTNNKRVDIEQINKKTGAKFFRGEKLTFDREKSIQVYEKDFLLKIEDKTYYINMTNGKKDTVYDIIDFKEGREKRLKILKDKNLVVE